MQLFVFLFNIYAIWTIYYHKLRHIIEIFKQWNVSIMLFLTLWIFAEIVCLFLQKSFVFAAIMCLSLQFKIIMCLFLRCRCCEAAEDAFKTLKWLAEPMILAVNRILTRRSIMTRKVEMKKKNIRESSEFWNSEDFWNSVDLQSPKGVAESKRICREFSVYKLILLFTKKRANRR